MPNKKFRLSTRDDERERPLAVAAAVKCAILVSVLCGIAWIGATQSTSDATALTLTASQSGNATR